MSVLVLPYTAVANQVAPSASYNANDAAIVAWANGNIDNTNIGSAGIFASQIKPLTAAEATFGATATGVGYKFLANDITAVPLTVSGVSGQTADLFDVTLTSGGTRVFTAGYQGGSACLCGGALWVNVSGSSTPGDISLARTGGASGLIAFNSALTATLDYGVTTSGRWAFSGGPLLVAGSYLAVNGYASPTASTPFVFGNTSATGMVIAANSSTASLQILNNAGTGFMNFTGGTYTNGSDASLKTNVAPIVGALATLAQLKPRSFDWIADGQSDIGFVAQEVAAVLPHIARTLDNGLMGYVPSAITALNTAAIIELAAAFKAYVAAHP